MFQSMKVFRQFRAFRFISSDLSFCQVTGPGNVASFSVPETVAIVNGETR